MYYKNYSIGYSPNFDETTIIKYDRDMTGFKDSDFNRADHIIGLFNVDTYKVENYQNYLDENGLFMGIFSPDIIEASIQEYYDKVEEIENERKVRINEKIKKPILESKFKKMKINNFSLDEVINYINIINEFNDINNGFQFPVEEYYKDILIKYWGDYKL